MNAGARSRRLSIETKVITGFSLAVLLVHLLTNQRYGYFRDELYFIACARQLDFGYVDLAPFSALMLRIDLMLFGTSLFALRLFPAIAGAFIVALTGALARQLRGRAWAAALSCTATLCALVYLSIGNFYFAQCLRTVALDWLRLPARPDHQRWTTAFVALVRSLRRTWTGEQTFDRLFCCRFGRGPFDNARASSPYQFVALAGWTNRTSARAAEHRRANATRLAHLGAAAKHRAQSQECRADAGPIYRAADSINEPGDVSDLVRRSLLAIGLAKRATLSRARFRLSDCVGRIHYHARQELLSRPSLPDAVCRRWRCRRARFRVANGMVEAGIRRGDDRRGRAPHPTRDSDLPPEQLVAYMRTIHLAPPRTETSHTAALPQLFADQFGWEEMVRSVGRVYDSLSPNEQKRAAIFCQNYGEAGAIDLFGAKYRLPLALSGHQNYFLWGPRGYTGEIVVVLEERADDEREHFQLVEDRGLVESSPWAMPWEQRVHVYICRGLKGTLRDLWPKLRN